MRGAAALLLGSLLLAGCGAKAPAPATSVAPVEPPLQGYVLDDALRPLAGAHVRVLDGNQSVDTDAAGHYALREVPRDQALVLVASLAQFVPSSKQVAVPAGAVVRVNFTLVPEAVKVPRVEVLKFDGFLACQAAAAPGNQTVDCSNGQQKDIWQFAASPGLEGAVVEVHWVAGTPMADRLHARLVTTDLGKLNVVLGEATGPDPLRIEVPRDIAMRYYGSGGLAKLYVNAVPASGTQTPVAGLAAQQDYTAYASLFYDQGAPAGYKVGTA